MTREEINILQDIVDIYEKEDMYPLLKDKQISTIKMVIEELEQEPSGDLISRQAVIEWLKAKDIIKLSSQEETARKELKALPSVKQEPLEVEATELQKAYNKGFEDCKQAVLEQINCWIGNGEYGYTNATHYLTERVKHIPPVNPQKIGHWIPTYGNVKCSVCGSVKDSREVGKATHYCDFCGARMVEQKESEE